MSNNNNNLDRKPKKKNNRYHKNRHSKPIVHINSNTVDNSLNSLNNINDDHLHSSNQTNLFSPLFSTTIEDNSVNIISDKNNINLITDCNTMNREPPIIQSNKLITL